MALTSIVPATSELLTAVELLRAGELVAFPTETVYGLGADARSAEAVAKIYAAKGRPPGNPLIVHAADLVAAQRYAEFSDVAISLAKQFWPGPLTLVLPRKDTITPLVSAGRSTVAIRVPKHPVAEALLNLLDGPIAAPSANRSTFTSPTTAQHVYAELDGRIPLILDGGPCTVGLESTVLDLTTSPSTLLRPGAVTAEMLRQSIGPIQQFSGTVPQDQSAASPGLHDRHYAPRTPACRFSRADWPALAAVLQKTANPCILLSHDPAIHAHPPHETIRLPEDATAYARVFYAALREADSRNAATLFILNPDNEQDLWLAIADRLRRATQEWAS
jgi:L-threonylcarbamoyladenylate synthase